MKQFVLFIIGIIVLVYFLVFYGNAPAVDTEITDDSTSVERIISVPTPIGKEKVYEIKSIHVMKNIYPALINYYKLIFKNNKIQRDIFAIEIGNSSDEDIQITINASIDDAAYPNQKIATIGAHSTDTVHLSPQLIPSYLVSNYEKQLKDLVVSVDLKTSEKTEQIYNETIPVTFLPVSTMKYSVYDKVSNKRLDTRPLLAAFVDPTFFQIDEILRVISKKSGGGFLGGYQELSAKPKRQIVMDQIKDIYYGLRQLEMSYISNPVDYSGDQKVKTPTEVIKYQSANCVEGVILMASIIESLGMQPLVVLVPGHSFVGWKVWGDSNSADFLETTMIWNVNDPDFNTAFSAGKRQYTSAVDEGLFKSGAALVLDVVELRSIGVLPISDNNSAF